MNSDPQPEHPEESPGDPLPDDSLTDSWKRASSDEEIRRRVEDLRERQARGEDVDEEFGDAPEELRTRLREALKLRIMVDAARQRAEADASPDVREEKSAGPAAHSDMPGSALRVRCPNCHARLQIVPDEDLSDLTCTSCGSHFGLVDSEQEATRDMSAVKSLGHFDLVDLLGRGAFGAVWKAYDRELDRTVAVKIPRRSLEENDAELFLREARAAAQLRHPHIVTIHEVGRVDDTVYIVSELITGIPLDKRLKSHRVTPTEAAQFCVLVGEALHAAHLEGVFHRDLKPSNILVNLDDAQHLIPHITDFGLARREQGEITMTVDGRVIGTPAYMPPEQARGEGHLADARSDVYSLGVVLFELCAGERPFRGDQQSLLFQVEHDEPPSPRKFNPRVSRDLETICLKCLEKSPERRYQTASELAVDLKRTLNGEPIFARPVGQIERAWRWCRRKPLVASLYASFVLLLLAVTGGVAINASLRATAAQSQANYEAEQRRNERLEADNLRSQLDREKEQAAAQRRLAELDLVAAEKELAEERERAARSQTFLNRAVQVHDADFRQAESVFRAQALQSTNPERVRAQHVNQSEALQQSLVPARIAPRRLVVGPVAVSPDGDWLVSADHYTSLIRVWRTSDWTQEFALAGHTVPRNRGGLWGTIRGLAFHPDDPDQLISAGLDGSVRAWSLSQHKELRAFQTEVDGSVSGLLAVAISPVAEPDGARRVVAARRDGHLIWLDLATLKPAGPEDIEAHQGFVTSMQFRPDGKQLASTGVDGLIRLWNADGTAVSIIEPPDRQGAEGPVALHTLRYSPDGRRLAVSGDKERIQLWDPDTNELVRTLFGHPADDKGKRGVHQLTWLDNTRLLSGGHDGTMRLWNAPDGEELKVLSGHVANMFGGREIRGLSAHPGKPDQIISTGADNTIRVWNLKSATNTHSLEGMITSSSQQRRQIIPIPQRSAYSVEADLLLTAGPSFDAFIRSWDLFKLRDRKTFTGLADLPQWDRIHAIAVHPAGSQFAIIEPSGHLIFWDPETGEQLHRILAHTPEGVTGREPLPAATALVFSQDGSKLFSTGPDHRFVLWNTETFEKLNDWPDSDSTATGGGLLGLIGASRQSPQFPDNFAAFIEDDTKLVTLGRDQTIRIWDIESRNIERRLQDAARIKAGALSASGNRVAVGSEDGVITIVDLKSGMASTRVSLPSLMQPGQLDRPLDLPPGSLRYAKRIAQRKASDIYGICFSLDDTHVAVTQGDGTLSVVHIATGSIVGRATGTERSRAGWRFLQPHFVKNGRLLTVADDGSLQSWDLPAWTEGRTDLAGSADLNGGQSLAARPDGSGWAIAANDKSAVAWAGTQAEAPSRWLPDKDMVNSLSFITGSSDLLVGTWLGAVKRVNPVDGREIATLQPARTTREVIVAVSGDGTMAAFSSADNSVIVQRFDNDEPLRKLPGTDQRVAAIAFRPDGKQLAVTDQFGVLRLWNITDENEPPIECVGPQQANGLDYSFDGRRLVQSGQVQPDKTIVIWNPVNGHELASLEGHQEVMIEKEIRDLAVYDADFSPDGKWLATCSSDATVRLWSTEFGEEESDDRYEQVAVISTKELRTLITSGPPVDPARDSSNTRSWLTSVAYSADSKEVAVVGLTGPVRVFDVETVLAAFRRSPAEILEQTERVTRLRLEGSSLVPIDRNRLVPVNEPTE